MVWGFHLYMEPVFEKAGSDRDPNAIDGQAMRSSGCIGVPSWAVLGTIFLVTCSEASDPSKRTHEWTELPCQYAQGFRILSSGTLRRAIVFGAGGPQDTLADLVIEMDAGAPGTPLDRYAYLRPLGRIAVVSTTHLSYLAELDAADRVVCAAYLDQVRDPHVRAQLPNDIEELAIANGPDREQLIALAPDALLDHPFGRSATFANSLPGIPVIPIAEYLEPHPLGRAEWIRFLGVLLNKELEADSIFEEVRTRYEAISNNARQGVSQPRIFFGSVWQGQWYVPGADSYMATILADAGGDYVFSDLSGTQNLAVGLETLLDRCREAEHFGVLLDLPDPIGTSELVSGDPRIASLGAVRNGGFCGNSSNADLFGRALLEPEVMLADLRCILYPGTCGSRTPVYFRKLDQ